MRFRPCIDLHAGKVKQIVGKTLRDDQAPVENFEAERPASWFADLYRRDDLRGGHVIMLGPGNEQAAQEALAAWPDGLQIGGGLDPDTAPGWLDRGAAAVIVTSYVFEDGELSRERLERMAGAVGADRLVLDLSCTRVDGRYFAAENRWQTVTSFELTRSSLASVADCCAELLIHATDFEGRQAGIDADLVDLLGEIAPLPTTYAGGIRRREDIDLIERLGRGRLDYTVGSALDLFGGSGLRYLDLVALHRAPP